MGLSGGFETQHRARIVIVADWNNCLRLFVLGL
jgi:hypothetical protein